MHYFSQRYDSTTLQFSTPRFNFSTKENSHFFLPKEEFKIFFKKQEHSATVHLNNIKFQIFFQLNFIISSKKLLNRMNQTKIMTLSNGKTSILVFSNRKTSSSFNKTTQPLRKICKCMHILSFPSAKEHFHDFHISNHVYSNMQLHL